MGSKTHGNGTLDPSYQTDEKAAKCHWSMLSLIRDLYLRRNREKEKPDPEKALILSALFTASCLDQTAMFSISDRHLPQRESYLAYLDEGMQS